MVFEIDPMALGMGNWATTEVIGDPTTHLSDLMTPRESCEDGLI